MGFNICKDTREWDRLSARVVLRSLEKVMTNIEQSISACLALVEGRGRNKVGILTQLYFVRLENPSEDYASQEGPEDTIFIKAIRNAQVRGVPEPLRSGGCPLQARDDGRRDNHRALTDMRMMWSLYNKGQVAALN